MAHVIYMDESKELPVVSRLSETKQLSKWREHVMKTIYVYSDNIRAPISTDATYDYVLPRAGFLSKLFIKHTFSIDAVDKNADFSDTMWLGLMIMNAATMFVGSTKVYEVRASDTLGMLQRSTNADWALYNEATLGNNMILIHTTDGAVNITFYTPLKFPCFDRLRDLFDTNVCQPIKVSFDMLAPSKIFKPGKADPPDPDGTLIISYSPPVLVAQYLDFGIAHRSEAMARYEGRKVWSINTHDCYHENTLQTISAAADTTIGIIKRRLECKNHVMRSYFMVAPNAPFRYMNTARIIRLTIYDGDIVMYRHVDDVETLLLNNTGRRYEEAPVIIADVTRQLVMVVSWGVDSKIDVSNSLDFSKRNMSYELEFRTVAGDDTTYNVYVSHEYNKQVMMRIEDGVMTVPVESESLVPF